MSFIESPRFPDSISAGSKYGPGYSTSVARNIGGHEFRNRNWSMPLYEGDVGYAVKDQDQLDELLAFFHGVAGMHNGFRFKNWNDFSASASQGTLEVITPNTTWQMQKTYTYGALAKQRTISKPLASVVIAGSGTYSFSTTTGIVTKLSGSNPTGWSGEFDDPVRFGTDRMLPMWISFELYKWESIPIRETREIT